MLRLLSGIRRQNLQQLSAPPTETLNETVFVRQNCLLCVCRPSLGSWKAREDAQESLEGSATARRTPHPARGASRLRLPPALTPVPTRSPFQLKGKSAREPDTEPTAPACPRREPRTRGQGSDLALAGPPSAWVWPATSLSPDVWLGLPRSSSPHLLYRLENSTERGRDSVDSKLYKQNQMKYF